MDFYDVVKSRKSVRAYKSDAIPKDALERIGEAVSLAPSACNLQPWNFRVVLNEEVRKQIHSIYSRDWLIQAPAIVVALGNKDTAWKRIEGDPVTNIDMGIAMEHLVLAAEAEGLATCWICAYSVPKMNKILNIIEPWSVLAITPLGYADQQPERRKRKPIEEVFRIIE